MDVLKQQLARIQEQLRGLSASQKMLVASLLAIMLMTIVWWGKYAGTSETAPLFTAALKPDELIPIKSKLSAEGIPFQIDGDRILVPTEQHSHAMAVLAFDQLLPHSGGNLLDVVTKLSPLA